MATLRTPLSAATPAAKRHSGSLPGRQRRTTFLSLAGGALGAGWILAHSPRVAQMAASSPYAIGGLGGKRQSARNGIGQLERQEFAPLRQPMYLANLACQTGEYVVSIRRINSLTFVFNSNPPYGMMMDFTEPLRVSLQVMSTRTGRIQQIDHINTYLTVTDNTGRQLSLRDAGSEFTFPDGVGCLFPLSEPAKNAAYLRSIDGVICLTKNSPIEAASPTVASPPAAPLLTAVSSAGQDAKRLPFHIANVPLPWKMHIFGLAGTAVVSGEAVRAMPLIRGAAKNNHPLILRGAEMEAVLSQLPQSAFCSPLQPPQPNQLTLAQDVPGQMQLAAPVLKILQMPQNGAGQSLPLTCSVVPRVTSNGNIQVGAVLTGTGPASVNASVSLWDNEPVLLALPASRLYSNQAADAIFVLYLDLHLDNFPPDRLYNGLIPRAWRPKKGEIGGAVSGTISTTKGPFGMATVKLTVTRTDAEETSAMKTATLTVALDKKGRFEVSNLAAGDYQMELQEIIPYQAAAIAKSSFDDFLAERMGISQAMVESDIQHVTLKPGGRMELSPWIFHESK